MRADPLELAAMVSGAEELTPGSSTNLYGLASGSESGAMIDATPLSMLQFIVPGMGRTMYPEMTSADAGAVDVEFCASSATASSVPLLVFIAPRSTSARFA